MLFLKSYYPVLAVAVFVLLIITAHVFAVHQYNWTKNTISDLGAQGYERKWIMQTGFILFGITIAAGIGINTFSWRVAPVFVYGCCVALTGIFCTKPFFAQAAYSETEAALHSLFAQIAGFAFSIGIIVQMLFEPDIKTRYVHLAFFVLVIGCSVAFGLLKNYQGIMQRLLYIISFIWLIKFYKP